MEIDEKNISDFLSSVWGVSKEELSLSIPSSGIRSIHFYLETREEGGARIAAKIDCHQVEIGAEQRKEILPIKGQFPVDAHKAYELLKSMLEEPCGSQQAT